jgi:hypothetical protein
MPAKQRTKGRGGPRRTPARKPVDVPPASPAPADPIAASPQLGWRPVGEVAELFGVTPQAFHQTYRPLVPASAVREGQRRVLLNVRAVIDAWCEHRVRRELEAKGIDGDLAGGGDSPALEEFRRHRARIAKFEADRLEKKTADTGEIRQGLMMFVAATRRGVEALQRQFGNDAAELVLTPLNQLEGDLDRVIPSPDPDAAPAGPGPAAVPDLGGPAAAAADHAGVRGAGDLPADGAVPGPEVQHGAEPVRRAAARPDRRR